MTLAKLPFPFPFLLGLALLLGPACSAADSDATDGGTAPSFDAGDPADPDAAPPDTCSFLNCDGCCDGNTCIEDIDEDQCGQSGSACQTCAAGDTCAAGSCVPDNDCSDCEGCCFEGTTCLEGNTLAACGADGDACVACPVGQGCNSSGLCEAIVCDQSNCPNGCCTANGECVTDSIQTTAACGTGGEACQVCDTDAVSCTLGTCILDQPCLDFCTDGCCTPSGQCVLFADQDTQECGAAETCGPCGADLSCLEGACIADPVWVLTVNSAVIDPTDANGEEWDQTIFSNPLPDPYVMGALSGDALLDWATATIDNTLTPNWDESEGSYLQSDLLSEGLVINVRDSDGLGVFESIGNCFVSVTLNDLNAGTLTKASCGRASNLVLDFAPQ